MDYIEGAGRDRLLLFPESMDEYIPDDNRMRFTDAFVDSLDLIALGFKHAALQDIGRFPSMS